MVDHIDFDTTSKSPPLIKRYQRIQDAINCFRMNGILIADDYKEKLKNLIDSEYYGRLSQREKHPSMSKVKKKLDRLQKAAVNFQSRLNDIDPRTLNIIKYPNRPYYDEYNRVWNLAETKELNTKTVLDIVNFWEIAAGVGIESIKEKTDAKSIDRPKLNLIRAIADAYKSTGRSPGVSRKKQTNQPSGPFFRLVKDIFNALEVPFTSDESILKSIEAAIK
jgi:hypothetical protein